MRTLVVDSASLGELLSSSPPLSSCYHTSYLVLILTHLTLNPILWVELWAGLPVLAHCFVYRENVNIGEKLNYATKKCCWNFLESTEVKLRRKIYLMVHAGWLPSCRIGPVHSWTVFWRLNICSLSTFLSQAPGTIQVLAASTEQ